MQALDDAGGIGVGVVHQQGDLEAAQVAQPACQGDRLSLRTAEVPARLGPQHRVGAGDDEGDAERAIGGTFAHRADPRSPVSLAPQRSGRPVVKCERGVPAHSMANSELLRTQVIHGLAAGT